ncbi:MAG: hypothetical protein V3T07_02685 [Myxococcota bacterium]
MPPRTLKETSSRKKSSEFVEAAITTQGADIGASLAGRLSTSLEEGEEVPDIPLFFTLIGRRMGDFRSAMVDTAQAHADELANDDAFREMRDQAMSSLTGDYVAIRTTFYQAFGPELALAIGFETNVVREPAALELQVDRLVSNLSAPGLELPEPRFAGVALSPPALVEVFQPNLDKLKAARAALDREVRKSDKTLVVKNQAVEAYDREFLILSRCLEAAFVLGGEPDLAKRVRPSLRRPGRRQEVENGEPEGDEPSPGDSPPSEDSPSDPPEGSSEN